GVHQRLPSSRERRMHERAHRGAGAGRDPLQRDQRRLDAGTGDERLGPDGPEERLAGGQLQQHRRRPVEARARGREPAIGDLALDHHAPCADPRELPERLEYERRGDRVRQVRHDARRRRVQRRKIHPHRVGEAQAHVVVALQHGLERRAQALVDLDRVDAGGRPGPPRGQRAEPWPDLEHDVVRPDPAPANGEVRQVLVEQEVLAEVRVRADAVLGEQPPGPGPRGPLGLGAHPCQPKARAAFVVVRASMAARAVPRRPARNRSVWATYSGRFGRPRRGTGARYGLSVSTSSRSSGSRRAAAWRSVALGKVSCPAKLVRYPPSTTSSTGSAIEKQWRTTTRPPASAASIASVSSSAARVWTTSASPSSRASPICAAKARRWASRAAWSRKKSSPHSPIATT